MKKFLSFLLFASVVVLPSRAEEITNHNNRLYFTVDNIGDIANVPVSLHLENPTLSITAVEMYLSLPEGVTIKSCQLDSRVESTHEITEGDTAMGYFVSVASEAVDTFAGVNGAVCTLMCDFSQLQNGDYTISASGMFAVGVNDDIVTSYIAENQNKQFTKQDDVLTGIDTVNADTLDARLEIYNMQGVRLNEPQKGQINIINGKKVIL